MGQSWPCFWTEPADTGVESYRRFVFSDKNKCAGVYGYHTASVNIGVVPYLEQYDKGGLPSDKLKEDLRWPQKCDGCDYIFEPGDEWQHNFERQYRRVDGVDSMGRYSLREMPSGAMWDAWWMGDWKGQDGLHLTVQLPNNTDWLVDGPTRDGSGGWQRTGDPKANPPTVSATPSILAYQGKPNEWHGNLVNGALVQC